MRPGAFALVVFRLIPRCSLARCELFQEMRTSLEHDLQSCFQRAAAADAVRTALSTAHGRRDLAERAAGEAVARQAKLRCVAQLKRIEAKLSRHFAIGGEVLYERKIVLERGRPVELVQPGIAHVGIRARVLAGAASGLGKGSLIEPLIAWPDAMDDVEVSGKGCGCRFSRRVERSSAGADGKRHTGDHGNHSADLPSSYNRIAQSGIEVFVVAAEWERVAEGLLEILANVEGSRSIVTAWVDIPRVRSAELAAAVVAKRLAPCKCTECGEAAGKALCVFDLQCIVVGRGAYVTERCTPGYPVLYT